MIDLTHDPAAGFDAGRLVPSGEAGTLRLGDRGSEIVELQKELVRALRRTLGAGGVFGPATREAVLDFQCREGLAADGLAGPKTRAALKAVS